MTREDAAATPLPRAGGDRRAARILAAAAVSAAIASALLLVLPWDQTLELWRSLSLAPLAAAALVLIGGYVTAGFRLQLMLPDATPVPLRDTTAASLWHGLGMILLPARLGELALIDGLRRYAGIAAGSGLAILLVQRIYDLILTSLAFGLGTLAILTGKRSLLLLIVAVAAVLVVLARSLDTLLDGCVAALARGRARFWSPLRGLLEETRDAARTLSAERVPALMLGTLLFWMTEFAALSLIFRSFGASLDLFTLLFLAAGLAFVHAVPLPTIGGLGLAEGGLAALLVATGVGTETAMSLGVSVRVTLLGLHALAIAATFPVVAWLRRAARGGHA